MAVIEDIFKKQCISILSVGAPKELSFLTASFSLLFTMTSIPGNILIISAVFLDPNRNLRSPFNWLVLNLATADLIVGMVTDPIMAYLHIKEGVERRLEQRDLYVIHMSYFISCTASVLSISTLAVERYLAMKRPHAYRSNVTNRRIVITVVGIWLFSLSLPNIYFKVGFTSYSFIFANTCVVVTVILTSVTYISMLNLFKERTQNTITDIELVRSTNFQTATVRPTSTISSSAREREMKVTKMFSRVLLAMLCCYGPSTICTYMLNVCKSCSCTTLHWLRDFHFIFILMNSSVNFWIYALQSQKFRSAFIKIIKRNR